MRNIFKRKARPVEPELCPDSLFINLSAQSRDEKQLVGHALTLKLELEKRASKVGSIENLWLTKQNDEVNVIATTAEDIKIVWMSHQSSLKSISVLAPSLAPNEEAVKPGQFYSFMVISGLSDNLTRGQQEYIENGLIHYGMDPLEAVIRASELFVISECFKAAHASFVIDNLIDELTKIEAKSS